MYSQQISQFSNSKWWPNTIKYITFLTYPQQSLTHNGRGAGGTPNYVKKYFKLPQHVRKHVTRL